MVIIKKIRSILQMKIQKLTNLNQENIKAENIKVDKNADAKIKKSSRSNGEVDVGINSFIIPCSVDIERNSLATSDIEMNSQITTDGSLQMTYEMIDDSYPENCSRFPLSHHLVVVLR